MIDYQWQLKITKIFSQNCQDTVNIAIDKTSDRLPNNQSERYHYQTKNTCYFYTKECT
ncbi:MAG: hypothetical protein O4808_03500 [Trichodesmium sp. St17_bin3_1_1]|nr:hypothetical protein [Trichodesmium sp. St17_bin3_1_1]